MYAADLHIHSKYSRATSTDCVPAMLDMWARRKGIGLIGSGDFTHPGWRQMLREQMVPSEDGLYTLREELRPTDPGGPRECRTPRFVVSGEISSIYKQGERVRKVHSLILLPSLEAADRLSARLEAIGNLHSDGRPILGLSAHDLLEITLDVCPQAVYIPAHIWTPHFSLFGAFSGFDSIEECYGDLASEIHALETGLSSDPPMNWRLSALDRFTLVSNSDAHSPARLGREMNLIDREMSYPALKEALDRGKDAGFAGTIEFFPEEGKYHFDGHRACGVCLSPSEAEEKGNLCPVCGKRMTMGVSHRVEQLADRPEGCERPKHTAGFESMTPLPEAIASCAGMSAASVRVQARYEALLHELGPELTILRELPIEEIERKAGAALAEGIRRMRCGQVRLVPGFDGEYGRVQLMDAAEAQALSGQLTFLDAMTPVSRGRKRTGTPLPKPQKETAPAAALTDAPSPTAELNQEQRAAAEATERVVAVVAGPGTGKTKTLVARVAHLIGQGVKPEKICAVTFTNKAASELKTRLQRHFGSVRALKGLTVGTFHSICLTLLRRKNPGLTVLDESGSLSVAGDLVNGLALNMTPQKFLKQLAMHRAGEETDLPEQALVLWRERLNALNALDFDGLLLEELASEEAPPFEYLLVDEYQDVGELQRRLTHKWSAGGKSLFVIGDPDQSIYGFRGSDAACFDRLAEEETDMRRIALRVNYRCTPEILSCAMPLIGHNPGEHLLEAGRDSGAMVRRVRVTDEMQEGIALAKEIGRMVGGVDMLEAQANGPERRSVGFSDIAVLYRTHRQADTLEKCLATEGIPYVVAGREDYLSAGSVRRAMAFFRFMLRPWDRAAMKECLPDIAWQPDMDETLETACAQLDSLGEEAVRLAETARSMSGKLRKDKPGKLLERYARAVGISAADADFEKLRNASGMAADMETFLDNLTMGEEGDISRPSGRKYAPDAVRLMTLHGAKGLEFPVVFLAGVRKGVLPLEVSYGTPADLQEERRLMYVGMTRAREELVILAGPEESAFMREIPAERMHTASAAWQRRPDTGRQTSFL